MNLNVRREDGYAVVELSGHVDMSSSPDLRMACLDLVRKRTPRILFNMRGVNYLDSSGVATLVECLQKLADYDGVLGLFGLTPRAKEIFDVTNLTQLFKFYDSEEEAVRSTQ